MTHTPLDPERLAALLDGRLSKADRAAVLDQLATTDEHTLAAFADASAVMEEMRTPGVVPISRRRELGLRPMMIFAAAAAIVVMIVPLARNGQSRVNPTRFALAAGRPYAPVTATVWSEQRGGSATVAPVGTSARIGARISDLILFADRNRGIAAQYAGDIATMVSNLPLSGDGQARFAALQASLADNKSVSTSDIRDAAAAIANSADMRVVDLGAWLEAARNAAVARDGQFFASKESKAVLATDVDAKLSSAAATALQAVRDMTHKPSSDWAELSKRLDTAMIALAAN